MLGTRCASDGRVMNTIENSTLYVTHTTAWASAWASMFLAPDAPPNRPHAGIGNPNTPDDPSPSGPSPERQSPEIPPDFLPPAPPEEPHLPQPGPGPGPGGPDVNPHEPIRVT